MRKPGSAHPKLVYEQARLLGTAATSRTADSASIVLVALIAVLVPTASGSAETNLASPAAEIRPLITKYCFECHDADTHEGGVDFSKLLSHDPLVRDREVWRRATQLLGMSVMPPESASEPATDADRHLLIAKLRRAIDEFDYSTIDDPGYVPLRRLTHREYNNTIRDLLGVDLKPAERFPSELTGPTGFDNSASTLYLQSSLMERYIATAERIILVSLPEAIHTEDQRRTYDLVFSVRPNAGLTESAAADAILRRFLLRAYRRPPTDDEADAFFRQYERSRANGKSFDEAIKLTLPAVLISPQFLFHVEAGNGSSEPARLTDWELASRLSYFMWATMPDDELFALAEKNLLHQPDVLKSQVRRMLADEKADTLGTVFAAQWFNTQLVGTRIRLDPIDEPWCTDALMEAMRAEAALFFMSLLRENRPLDDLVDADYTFVNADLAHTFYGMPDVEGSEMRRVKLDDENRGGILGQPSVLAVTSSRNQTSPVKRGIFVLDTVLGTPPPPPPPNAGKLDPKLENSKRLTFREKLEQHASDSTCRACHATMDPVGFALENFDYFGRWRDGYGKKKRPIDATGVLPDGTKFDGPASVKKWILEVRHKDLTRQAVVKTLSYALGRNVEYYDEPAIQKIVARLEENDSRMQTLLEEVVLSYPFQFSKEPEESP